MKVREIVKILEEFAKPSLIDSWDNCGLQIGDMDSNINKILISLDLDENVLDKAINEKYQMIVTHHPIIFRPIKRITNNTYSERLIIKAIKHDIAIYTAHSNLDMAEGGVNDELARLLGIRDTISLNHVKEEKLYKLAVYVPETHQDNIRHTLGNSGAGSIGNYSHCTFNIEGIGTFLPNEGSNAFIGELGKLEKVKEIKIETIVKESDIKNTVANVLSNHPYEEVAYDIYEIKNGADSFGYGRIGNIDAIDTVDFLDKIKSKISSETLIVYGDINRDISRIAVCGGSGAEFIHDAYEKGAQLYLTGDIKYHEAQLAQQLGIIIVDGGHYNTEKIILPVIKKLLVNKFSEEVIVDIHNESSVTRSFY